MNRPVDAVASSSQLRQPLVRISPTDLENLMTALEVSFVRLTECVVSPGWRLLLGGTDAPGVHYNLNGFGHLAADGHESIPLVPHTMVILPPRQPFRLEVHVDGKPVVSANSVKAPRPTDDLQGTLRRFSAGSGEPQMILICGYFRATYGASVDLFSGLASPIVEQFDATDRLDDKLKMAFAELIAQEVGVGAMTSALLKQVLVTLLRRSLSSHELWVERFSVLSDVQIARAFADMVARPGAAHSVLNLARTAGLSRSVFMERFSTIFGNSPMAILRQLRTYHAAALLKAGHLSVDQVAREVGYTSRSSFVRTFKDAFGLDPSEYRAGGKHHRNRGSAAPD